MKRTPWLTAAELARLLKVPTGTIYRRAHVEGWRRTEDGKRPVLYCTDDALRHAGARPRK